MKGKEVGEGEKRVWLGVHGAGGGSVEAEGGCKMTGGMNVRIGNMVVTVRGGKGKGVEKREVEKVVKKKVEEVVVVGKETGNSQGHIVVTCTQPVKKLVRMYRSHEKDLKWAYNGVVTSVINGEAIPMVQNRIKDAGFTDLDIIPMDADRVFIRSLSGVDILQTIEVASEFFNLILANVKKWDKSAVPFQRGVWLRLYGIPLHPWNEYFFRLCVMDCGRYLRTDSGSLEKERFDFSRVLVSTTSLEIISLVDKLLINGILVEVKIVEEWGFSIGEDECLFEDVNDGNNEQHENEDIHVDPDVSNNVDTLVVKIVEELEATELKEDLEQIIPDSPKNNGDNVYAFPLVLHKVAAMPSAGPMGESGDHVDLGADVRSRCALPTVPTQGCVDGVPIQLVAHSNCGVSKPTIQRIRAMEYGLVTGSSSWSMEWLRDQVHGTVGIVSSSRKKGK